MPSHQVEVIGAGWGRTGTSSLKKALEILGYDPTYHMLEVIQQNHVKFWQRALAGEKVDFDEVFDTPNAKCSATCDFPSALFWKEQLQQYSNAVVVLSVRDPEKWYKSCSQTIFRVSFNSPFSSIWIKIALMLGIPRPSFGSMTSKMYDISFRGLWEKDDIIASFNAHNDRIKRECPPEKLLVYDITEGWEPLCKFLKKPIPDVPFPHVNDTAEFQKHLNAMTNLGYITAAASILIPAVAGYFLAKYLGRI